jgi:hypothetical protein
MPETKVVLLLQTYLGNMEGGLDSYWHQKPIAKCDITRDEKCFYTYSESAGPF